jgi:hypothetical protein
MCNGIGPEHCSVVYFLLLCFELVAFSINFCRYIFDLRYFWLVIYPMGPILLAVSAQSSNGLSSKCKPFLFLICYIDELFVSYPSLQLSAVL